LYYLSESVIVLIYMLLQLVATALSNIRITEHKKIVEYS
jgi:hypothetical protein